MKKINKTKIEHYIEFIATRIKVFYKEKTYKFHPYELKYILEKADNDTLIVVFSGIPRPGIKARYNYNRTLKPIDANKLFILDDFGFDQRGAYYLGKDKDFLIQQAVKSLITKVKSERKIKRLIFTGSSKGGWAAMYFGIQEPTSIIIAGSLQYLLGNYLISNDRRRLNMMSYIMGQDFSENDVEYLNELLRNTLHEHSNNNNDIYLHYSDNEFTYEEFMKYLIHDLKKFNIPFEEDVQHYNEHQDLAIHFPGFLVKKLREVQYL